MSTRPQPAPEPEHKRKLTADQQRAQWAWDAVKGGVTKEYVKLSKSVPTLIMGSGLLQTVAFLEQKKHKVLLAQLVGTEDAKAAIAKLVALKPAEYRAETEAALAKLRWLRHFAAVAPEKKDS